MSERQWRRERPPPEILSPVQMPRIVGVRVPQDVYFVLEHPAPLAGMAFPSPGLPWAALAARGIRHVVCLTHRNAPYDPSPLDVLHAIDLEDLFERDAPVDGAREEREIRRAAAVTVAALSRGEGVVVHCVGGTGRTGTVHAAVLAELGLSPTAALAALVALHRDRGRHWPESPWQRAFVERLTPMLD